MVIRIDKSSKLSFVIITITLCIGFIPILLSSIFEGTFTFNGRVNLPYITNSSVWFGDLFLLPVFNAILIRHIIKGIKERYFELNTILFWFIGSFIISFLVSVIIHVYLWAADDITGFMDINLNQLSIAGILHLIYTALQMPVVILYFIFRKRLLSNIKYRKPAIILGRIIFIFTLLSFINFYIANIIIFNRTFVEAFRSDWINLMTIPSSFVLLLLTRPRNSQKS